MFALIPYRVDVPYDRRPVANWLIIVGLILVFALQVREQPRIREQTREQLRKYISEGHAPEEAIELARESILERTIYRFGLRGWTIRGLFGHMWLHGGMIHLAGNLFFLWLFGNALCAKLGSILYVPIYGTLGLIAGMTHLIFADAGLTVGASGAINGIVGMYLVFFPENAISCLCILIPLYAKTFVVRSFWMILLWFVFDILGALCGTRGVGYFAHIGGFISGAALAVLMLKQKWLTVEKHEKSLLELIGLEKAETDKQVRPDSPHWQREWISSDKEKREPETTAPEQEKSEQQFIRFRCPCGQSIKVARQHAGKIGRCPKCSTRLKVPQR